MKQNASKPAAPPEVVNAGTDGQPSVNSPRPRRMARESGEQPSVENAAHSPRALSKIAQVLALLRRAEGATLSEMVEATGWLPHTTRAALTGLRKKGHNLEKSKRGDATCYRIVVAS
jgi:hypothetical protein